MLLDNIVDFCDREYTAFGTKCGCINGKCNHPSGQCSGNCYNCLYQVHFPYQFKNGKRLYDCQKMLYHYVCQYSYLYTTELLCAFDYEWSFIRSFPYHSILSLGCGGCADLMAFELLRQNKFDDLPISYMGIDVNKLWTSIHNQIRDYSKSCNISFQMHYDDVFEIFRNYNFHNINIIVISYLISYLYNTDQIKMIDKLAELLASAVIKQKSMGLPILLVINDVNSNYRGRDFFEYFEKAIRISGFDIIKSEYKYFDSGRLNPYQKIGSAYSTDNVVLNIPDHIQRKYHAQDTFQSTIQLLIEVR